MQSATFVNENYVGGSTSRLIRHARLHCQSRIQQVEHQVYKTGLMLQLNVQEALLQTTETD